MNSILQAIATRLRSLRLVHKLFIGYILLICIPFAVFGFVFYRQMYMNQLDHFKSGKTQMIEQAYRNLEVDLTKIEAMYPLFQNNTSLIDYLGGFSAEDWDQAYIYKKEIGPTFSFAYISNQLVDKITMYKADPQVPILSPEVEDIARFTEQQHAQAEAVEHLPPNKGLWVYEASSGRDRLPSIRYLHKMYNTSYTRTVGLLQLTLNDGLIKQFFNTQQSNDEVWRMVADASGRILYEEPALELDEQALSEILPRVPQAGMASFYTKDRRYLIGAARIERFNLTLVEVYKTRDALIIGKEARLAVGLGLLLLTLLSVMYFTIASSITLRIVRFSRHMRRVDDSKNAIYPADEGGADEIGYLISAYNSMISRVDELKRVVTQTELLKKEAEIKMLQAQINPHFLYNTLETMCMLAAMNDDDEVADIGLKLGKLLRYSLSKTKDESTLGEELENVRHYLDIHRVRMGDKLITDFVIHEEALRLPCPRFILQPLVENSILHGFKNVRGPAELRLELLAEESGVLLRISDSGSGIPAERLTMIREVLEGQLPLAEISSSGGIGLHNVNERLKAFFGSESTLDIQSTEGRGTVITSYLAKGGRRHA
ncbi:sensor histidine kinase [uncultured Paenibacillus sp.]|uniref:sensor histidine kinase n=1 Tax=uncultured Paenibacillus sp. TaxID=227322 RepID=UPI0015B0E1AE|nr:histidine kinase [uncultured Paenibacillus sp.]